MDRMCSIDWSAVAAWVQAIFSIVGIFVAIVVAKHSSEANRLVAKESNDSNRALVESERKRQADIVASMASTRLMLTEQEIENRADRAISMIDSLNKGEIAGLGIEALDALFTLVNPKKLNELKTQVFFLDSESGIALTTVMDILESYNDTTPMSFRVYVKQGSKPDHFIRLMNDVSDKLRSMLPACQITRERLETIHE